MTSFEEFWGRAGPGLLDAGIGLYNKNAAQKEAQKRLATAQGGLFSQAMGGAGATLAEAGGFNPDALAASRFGAGEALVAPVQEKQLADLRRSLLARGMLGAANYNPGVEGITPSGTPMNPEMAAFFAAQNADRAKRAAGASEQGQAYADRLVNRAGSLQRVAGSTQGTGITAQNTQPSRAAGNAEILRGLFKTPGLFKDIFSGVSGMFGGFGGDGYGDIGEEFTIW